MAPVIAAWGAANGPRRCSNVTIWLRAFPCALLLLLTVVCASAAEPKRVLLVHSFGSATPPFTVESTAFESELVEKMGERVDLDEVSLDMARYADGDMQEAIVDYLQKRQAKWRPDLVVTIGSPAGIFVSKYRERLFPDTPIVYATMDRRLMPAGALEKNATYIGQVYDVSGFIEDILQIAPGTKNIAVVVGATPLEHLWQEVFQKAAEPFAGRIKFTYYNNLSFDEMKAAASRLPPDSYIFFLLLLRDAVGVTLNADEALQRLHDVAQAPINSIFAHQMGLGIVGGRLHPSDDIGKEAAQVAIRILHGEPASSFPPKILGVLPPRYDWRELQRWKIDEKLLPPGSVVLFREPTVWQHYKAWIIAGLSIFVLQTLLISGLFFNRIRRRRAEVSLGESEKRFQTVADAAPVLIWLSGEDMACTYVNKPWLAFTGQTLEHEIGDGWSKGIHPEDLEYAVDTYRNAFAARQPFVMQYRLKRHDGEYRWLSDQGVPRYGPRGNFRGYVGACIDISELLNQEAALHEIKERIALAAEAAHLGVWELDLTTNTLWLSDEARGLFQLPRETLSYEEFQAFVHPDDRAGRDAAIRTAIANRDGFEFEYRVVLPDGSIRWINGRARCIRDNNGKLSHLLGVSIDITTRKQAEELFRLATEASPSGTLLVDQKCRIILVNAHSEELFGYTRDELIDERIELLLPSAFLGADPDSCADFLAIFDKRAIDVDSEVIGRRKDGSEFPAEVGLSPITTSQDVLVLVTVVDISARKAAAEEARQRRQQVDLLSRVSLLGEMTASLAHELNQPLSAIVNNATAIMQYMDRGKLNTAQLKEILTDVVADSRRAHDIIHNVRRAIKKGTAIRGRINLNDVVRAVAHMVFPDAAAQFCKLETFLTEELPAVEGDPTQIQQVLINLVRNAFDAMHMTPPSRRVVEIATSYNGDGSICVGVRDHGSGIPEATRDRLFEQFFTTKEEGLGMGLSIVRSIVEAHGGSIGAENVDSDGARFFFHLPIIPKTTK